MTDQDIARFWDKVNIPADPWDCWLWTACINSHGYGQFGLNGKVHRAHRVSYTLCNADIPDGLFVRHTCHNPLCVNPAHLIVGTQQDNMDDKVRAGRQAKQKGEAHGRSKLTDSDVREIRDLAGWFTQREIGDMYGVKNPQISDIILRKKWKHIE